jgi:hypothetical protein
MAANHSELGIVSLQGLGKHLSAGRLGGQLLPTWQQETRSLPAKEQN